MNEPLASNDLATLIRRVNARIPDHVTPLTRIVIHPSEWLTLVEAATAHETNEGRTNQGDSGCVMPSDPPQMAMLPNDHHPGPRCSCAYCLKKYPNL